MGFEIIEKYFPNLSENQINQFKKLGPLYEEWNAKINVISRKDMDAFYERHVLHALAIAKVIDFKPGTKVLDVGTGGGFPGIPLAIFFPEVQFHLVDSIGKKITVVNEVVDALGLKNVKAEKKRAEELKSKYDFVVSRAVTAMPKFISWIRKAIDKNQKNAWPNGILYLKGGDLKEELKDLQFHYEEIPILKYFSEDFFDTKKVVYVKMV